jgi:hypothetical protein
MRGCGVREEEEWGREEGSDDDGRDLIRQEGEDGGKGTL